MEGAGPLLAGLGCEEVWLGWAGGQVLGQQETLQLVTSLHTGVQECRTLAMDKLQTLKYMPLIDDRCMQELRLGGGVELDLPSLARYSGEGSCRLVTAVWPGTDRDKVPTSVDHVYK